MKRYSSLFIILLSLPFILFGVVQILPTFDDFTTLQSPCYMSPLSQHQIPADAVRRPFDFLFGLFLGYHTEWFPLLNHLFIIAGHSASTLLVFKLCRKLSFGYLPANIAALFFFFSPATLGATLACDGLNQTYSQLWGLTALWCYLNQRTRLWPLFVIIAVLSKENGLAWAVVPPVIAYGFDFIDKKKTIRHFFYGILIAIGYFAVFSFIYASGIVQVEYPNEYGDTTIIDHLKDFVQLMAYTWIPIDFVSIVYSPMRNYSIAALTMLLSLPFIAILLSQWRTVKDSRLMALMASFFIVVSPHLVTLISIMHNYAALSIAALIIAMLVNSITNKRLVTSAFILFLLSAIFTDLHHYQAAYGSGLLGKNMALEVMEKTGKPVKKVYCISIDNPEEPCYSNFCVRPIDAFAWGFSVQYYTNYQWPEELNDTIFNEYNIQTVNSLADSLLQSGYDCVWLVGHNGSQTSVFKDNK